MVAMEAKTAQVQAYLKLLFVLGSTANGSAAEAIFDPSIFALCSPLLFLVCTLLSLLSSIRNRWMN
jgi:hypothetical protein